MLETGQTPPELMVRFVSYLFLHASFSHGLFAMVILLAMGKIVSEALGAVAFVTIFFLSGIMGAVAFGLISDDPWLIGAFPSVYGLIGGFTFCCGCGWGRRARTSTERFR